MRDGAAILVFRQKRPGARNFSPRRSPGRLHLNNRAFLHSPLRGVHPQSQSRGFGENNLRKPFLVLLPGDHSKQRSRAIFLHLDGRKRNVQRAFLHQPFRSEVSAKIICASLSWSSCRAITRSSVPGRFFFIWMGERETSSAPSSISRSKA